MVERVSVADPGWAAVDDYIAGRLLGDVPALTGALGVNRAAELPDIDVSPPQGRMLHLLVAISGAKRVLEIGALGGYSGIELARGLPAGGALTTLEIDPHHAVVAEENFARAGLSDRVTIIIGPAAEALKTLEGPFDFIFIDADKPSNVTYLREALRLSRIGTTIVVDNVVREGGVLDADSADERIRGTRALFDAVAAEPRLTATAVQTVGSKKWDGFLLAVVTG